MFNPEHLCLWRILDYSHQILLGLCIYIFDFVAIILNIWLGYAFVKSRLLTFHSHLLLLNLCIASTTKTIFTSFIFFGTSALAGRWLFGSSTCHLYAFLRQKLSIFQMLILTFLAIERYIITRPKRKGADLPLWFYITVTCVSWLIAFIFSLPPLLGYGSYNCDVTGTVCELDWRNLTPHQVCFNILLAVFVGCVSPFIIFTCLWGVNCANYKIHYYKNFNHSSFTKTITIMTVTIFLFWTPQAILSLWIFVQNLHPPRGIPVALSLIAPIAIEAAEIIPTLCYLTYDERLRAALIEACENIRYNLRIMKSSKFVIRK